MRMVVGVVSMGFRTACSRMVMMRHGGTIVLGGSVDDDSRASGVLRKDWLCP